MATEIYGAIAALFPGQGSQEKGMGREAAESLPEAMEIWKLAEAKSGSPLREIFWDGEEKDMADTRVLQPGLTAANLSLWLALRGKLAPAFVAGHSLGEFSALCVAGALPPADILELVSLRGRLMAEAGDGSGGMAALLKLDQAGAEALVAEAREATGKELRVANYNTPAQFVVSGHKDAVAKCAELAKGRKARAVELAVSGAFHSPLMAEAAAEFARAMERFHWASPKIPVVFNATAGTESDPAKIRKIMADQMVSSVLWIQTIGRQWDEGVRTWVEVGPKGVLTRMLGQILSGKDDTWASHGVGNIEQAAAFAAE